jgi:hypothetical protein
MVMANRRKKHVELKLKGFPTGALLVYDLAEAWVKSSYGLRRAMGEYIMELLEEDIAGRPEYLDYGPSDLGTEVAMWAKEDLEEGLVRTQAEFERELDELIEKELSE